MTVSGETPTRPWLVVFMFHSTVTFFRGLVLYGHTEIGRPELRIITVHPPARKNDGMSDSSSVSYGDDCSFRDWKIQVHAVTFDSNCTPCIERLHEDLRNREGYKAQSTTIDQVATMSKLNDDIWRQGVSSKKSYASSHPRLYKTVQTSSPFSARTPFYGCLTPNLNHNSDSSCIDFKLSSFLSKEKDKLLIWLQTFMCCPSGLHFQFLRSSIQFSLNQDPCWHPR